MAAPELPWSQACENNKGPILAVLREHLGDARRVLEIGSGTGQHAVHFAAGLPRLRWLTSDLPANHEGIRRWMAHAPSPNLEPPLALDVTAEPWPAVEADAVFSANTAHIMAWPAVEALFRGVAALLPPQGLFLLYGPFRYDGQHTSAGNERFDASLRGQSGGSMGIRDFESVLHLAGERGLSLVRDHAMPANNRTLVFEKIVIRLQAVSKSYREAGRARVVLDRVDLEVARGEMVCLMGRSGSGKSTLLNVVSGIDTPDSGQVLWGGEDLARMADRERTLHRRAYLGFVFQFFNLIPTLSVAENVRLPLELNGRADGGRVEQWLRRVGLADRRDSFPDTLSGGEQQRVALARALVHEPLLLLADEPTGNLDADTADGLLELLHGLCTEQRTGLLIASHGEEIARAADRVLTLDHGRLRPRAP